MGIIDNLKNIVKNFADTPSDKEKASYDEIGYARESVWSTYLDEEKSTDSIKIEDYIKMKENDGEVQGLVKLISTPVVSTGWEIVSPDGNEDGEEVKFIKENFENSPGQGGMDIPLQLIIADMTRAFTEGFRLYEKVWELRNGKIYLKKLAPRDAKTITLQKDEHGEYKGAVQRIYGNNKYNEVVIPGYKTMLYTFQKEEDWLYGRSILKSAYYHYDKKHKLYYISHKAAELQTVPPKVIKYEAGSGTTDDQKKKIENAVDRLGVNTRVSIPAGISLETFEYKGSSTVSIKDLIDHHNSQMLKSALAQMMDLGTEKKSGGSYALSQTQSDYFTMFLESEMKNMASHINWYVIPQLIDWNFGTGIYPQLKFNPIKDSTKALLQEVFKSLITGKSSTIPDIFYKSILNKTADDLNLGISEKEIEDGMSEKKQEVIDSEQRKTEQAKAQFNQSVAKNNVVKDKIVKKEPKLADIPVNIYGRELRPEEMRINLSEIEDAMDTAENNIKNNIQGLYFSQKKVIMEYVKKAIETKDTSILNKIVDKLAKKYADYLYVDSLEILKLGVNSASKEMVVDTVTIPQDKLDLLRTTAESVATKEINDLIWIGQTEVTRAIKNPTLSVGDVTNVVSSRMDDKFNYNINATASVTVTNSLNEGRGIVFAEYINLVYAFEYSAILDKKTCPTCQALDGSVIAPNNPAYYQFMPPIHFFCRCIWVGIRKTEINPPPITGMKGGLSPNEAKTLSDIDSFIPYIQEIEKIRLNKERTQNDIDRVKQIYDLLPDKYKVYAKELFEEVNDGVEDENKVRIVKRIEEIRAIEHPTELDLKEINDILAILPSNLRYIAEEVITQIEAKIAGGN